MTICVLHLAPRVPLSSSGLPKYTQRASTYSLRHSRGVRYRRYMQHGLGAGKQMWGSRERGLPPCQAAVQSPTARCPAAAAAAAAATAAAAAAAAAATAAAAAAAACCWRWRPLLLLLLLGGQGRLLRVRLPPSVVEARFTGMSRSPAAAPR